MPGRPISIATPIPSQSATNDESDRFSFNHDLPKLIASPVRLSRTPVVIISVAGAFRKGKSFLLNFFIRYLNAISNGNTRDWIRQRRSLDDGFPWRSGTERDTAGILIWSEPFFIRRSDNSEVAVILMDTQGTFDHQSTQKDCTTIFAFSTLLSSVQIFNISQNIQETDLQYLRLFVEFASMTKQSKEKVLQHLWFLVRDWQNPDEYEYGDAGGQVYLDGVLACDSRKPKENQELRRGIKQHFEKASCCLLPHPGKAVTTKAFNGEVEKLDSDFVNHLERFVTTILSPRNLVVKKVNGKELTGREYFELVEVYFEAFRLGKLPTPKSIFMATVEMANMTASSDAKRFFDDSMRNLLEPKNAISELELDGLLQVLLDQSLEQFDLKCMNREAKDTRQARKKLEEQLLRQFEQQHVLNKLKSDKIAVDKKNVMMKKDIQRMQNESLESAKRTRQLEQDFAKRLREIKSSSVTKQQMEAMLEEAHTKHSLALKESENQAYELNEKIEEIMEMNRRLVEEMREGREQAREELRQMSERQEQQLEKLRSKSKCSIS